MRTGLNRECLGRGSLAKLALGASLSAFMFTGANAEVDIGANIELDTDYIKNDNLSDADQDNDFDFGGRVKVIISSDHSVNDTTVLSGVGQFLIKENGDTGVDDAFLRLGSDTWGLKVGRYEAIDLHSKGTDTLVIVADDVTYYQANKARGRISEAGQLGLEISPSDRLSFFLDTVWGESDSDEGDENDSKTAGEKAIAGYRPAIQFDLTDDLRLTAGYDYLEDGATETKGGGIYVRYATDAFALKFNVAKGQQETGGVEDWDTTSFNINVESGNIGLGYINSDEDDGGSFDTIYARYLFPNLMGYENANAQIGLSYLDGELADGTDADSVYGIRLRLFYEF